MTEGTFCCLQVWTGLTSDTTVMSKERAEIPLKIVKILKTKN